MTAIIFVSACQATPSLPPNPLTPYSPTVTPFQPVLWTAAPEEFDQQVSPTSLTPDALSPETLSAASLPPDAPFSLYIAPALQSSIYPTIQLPEELPLTTDPNAATLKIFVGEDYPVTQWIYALVAPFPTAADGVSARDLRAAWKGESSGVFVGFPLLMSESTLGMLSAYWGQPTVGAVRVHSPEKLLKIAWDQQPSWAIVPFEQLNPRWKVLSIDGISPIHKDFDLGDYELAIPISMTGVAPELPQLPPSNRDPEKMTVLAMTGVTALVRATAFTMEQQGELYPAIDIGPILQAADITHISNEVPFAEDCPYPNPVQEGVRFCSRTKYIELLESVDTDIVELTGDHFADWGTDAMRYTLDLYDQRGWSYYGGGANFKEGRKPVIIEHNGNKLAFIGCNAKGGGYATASESSPGAVYCDWDWMVQKIAELRAEDYLPIATFQHFEYYTYAAQPNQIRDAERMTAAGAMVVSGSQAHQPQAFGFSQGGFVHHGLGNLFFDQLDVSEATRQGFIDLHVFYDGQHISTELVTIYFVDYARARLMTPQERANLLQAVFSASGW
jgi:poly-gamma-glutamate synthesis protein (capsule biosynthesis protein)